MIAAWVLGCLAGLILGWRAREWWTERRERQRADRLWREFLVTRAKRRAEQARCEKAADAAGRRRGRMFDMPPADMQRQMLSYAACCGIFVVAVAPTPGAPQ